MSGYRGLMSGITENNMYIHCMAPDSPPTSVLMDGSVPLGGVYANLVDVWHTALEFTVEFAVSLPAGSGMADAVCVAWMKVPPPVAWDLARLLSDHVADYESEYGSFTPRPPDERESS